MLRTSTIVSAKRSMLTRLSRTCLGGSRHREAEKFVGKESPPPTAETRQLVARRSWQSLEAARRQPSAQVDSDRTCPAALLSLWPEQRGLPGLRAWTSGFRSTFMVIVLQFHKYIRLMHAHLHDFNDFFALPALVFRPRAGSARKYDVDRGHAHWTVRDSVRIG